ncbi:hypothetical protein KPL70_014370 [Citrus sinensis]|nr:hypothetical protein KPL70_014370 [Citrus sinensis]
MSSSTRGKGLNKHFWTEVEDAALTDCGFKNGYLQKLDAILEEKLPGCGLKGDPHIGSRVKTLKTKWSVLHDMLCLSGFGWDSGAMKLICDKSVFEDCVKKRPAASDLLNKPFPHYYTLGEIYGRDRATRANAGNADDNEEEVRQEDNLNVNLGNDSTNKVSANKSAPSQAENAHNRDTGGMNSSVKVIAESLAGMIPKLDGLINVLSTQDKEVADLLAKKMKATNMLATKPELLRVFFNMPSSMKKGYVLLLLSGDM